MYYFILEQAKNRWQANFQNKIVSFLEDMQIIGEVVKANPIQKPEELASLGLKKSYHTIVVVASDIVISSLAPIIATAGATLGIIPTDEHSSFFSLINCQNWEEAAKALPKRRIETFDMGQVADKFFLTFIRFVRSKGRGPVQTGIKFNTFDIDVPAQELIISNGDLKTDDPKLIRSSFEDGILNIYIVSKAMKEKSSFLGGLFKKEEKLNFSSLIPTKNAKIYSEDNILNVVSSDNKILTKTPAEIKIVKEAIKIIVKKAINSWLIKNYNV